MFTRAEIKAQAKAQLKGKVGMFFLCLLIVYAITFALCFIPLIGVIGMYIVLPPLMLGLIMVCLNVTYGDNVEIGTLFKGFNYMGKSIALFLMILFFTMLWSLLFVIPGIIKSYSYSMAFYILAENPEMSAREALNESKEIMKGNKLNLFVLQLSFILWELLATVTFGIAYVYVLPYMQLTFVNFYHNIKRQPVQTAAAYEEPVYVEATEDVVE